MTNFSIFTTALVPINKRAFYYFDKFSVAMSKFTKYPIFLESLISRINILRAKYSISSPLRIYDLSTPEGKEQARKDLRGKGGVYCF